MIVQSLALPLLSCLYNAVISSSLKCISPVCWQPPLWSSHVESSFWGTLEARSVFCLELCLPYRSVTLPFESPQCPLLVNWIHTVTLLEMISWWPPQMDTGRSVRCSPFPESHVTPVRDNPVRRWRMRGGRQHSGTACHCFAHTFCRTDT